MSERRVLLDTAAFMDSRQALSISDAATAEIRTITTRFLGACYEDLGVAPRKLDGEQMAQLLTQALPARFGVRDPLAVPAESVLTAYLDHLTEVAMLPNEFELRRALAEHATTFCESVTAGAAHRDGLVVRGKGQTVTHQVARTGRNDPCPCGSGKKFKKCCQRLGE